MSQSENFAAVPLAELFAQGVTAQPAPKNPVVLIVDDEVVICRHTHNNSCAAWHCGHDRLYRLGSAGNRARHSSDLLLADVVMPGMSGIDVAIAIKRDIPDCAILLFSGQAATKGLLAKAGKAWCDFEVLLKPIHPEKLVKLIFERLQVNATKLPCGHAEDDSQPRLKVIS